MKEHEGMYQIKRIMQYTEYFLISKEKFTDMENLDNFDVVKSSTEYTASIMDYETAILGTYLPTLAEENFNNVLQDIIKYWGIYSDTVSIKVVSSFEDIYYKIIKGEELKETIREILLDQLLELLPLEDIQILRDSTGMYLNVSYGQCWTNSVKQPGFEHYIKIYFKNCEW